MLAHTAGPDAPSAAVSFSFDAFDALTERLSSALDTETDALELNRPCDLAELTQRKRQALLELSRFMPRLVAVGEQDNARGRLGALAIKLERNRMALDVQLRAVREVADIIARTIKDAESDGTYSMTSRRS